MSEKSCENCMEYRRGECLANENEMCMFFKPAPTADREAMQNWPKEFYHRRAQERRRGKGEYEEPPEITKRKQWQRDSVLKQVEREKARHNQSTSIKIKSNIPASPKDLFTSESRSESKPVDSLLSELYDKLIIWASYDTYSDGVYRVWALLQYSSTVKRIDSEEYFSDKRQAMCQGILNAIKLINRPCTVYVIPELTLKPVMKQVEYKKCELAKEIEEVLRSKKCYLHEIVIDGYKYTIRKQIHKPTVLSGEVKYK